MNKDTIKEVMEELDKEMRKFPANTYTLYFEGLDETLKETARYAFLKQWLTSKLQEVRAETIKECISAEPKRRKLLHSVVAKGSQEDLNDTWRHGYNSALDDYKSSLTKLL